MMPDWFSTVTGALEDSHPWGLAFVALAVMLTLIAALTAARFVRARAALAEETRRLEDGLRGGRDFVALLAVWHLSAAPLLRWPHEILLLGGTSLGAWMFIDASNLWANRAFRTMFSDVPAVAFLSTLVAIASFIIYVVSVLAFAALELRVKMRLAAAIHDSAPARRAAPAAAPAPNASDAVAPPR
jgi:hypothetical protein